MSKKLLQIVFISSILCASGAQAFNPIMKMMTPGWFACIPGSNGPACVSNCMIECRKQKHVYDNSQMNNVLCKRPLPSCFCLCHVL
jgi:hypothetical protein